MKKTGILFILALSLITIYGCASNLPPEPTGFGGSVPPVGEAGGYYEGYGPPFDVYNNDEQIMFLSQNVFNIEPEQKEFGLGVTVRQNLGYVYKKGYYYANGAWQLFEFPQQAVSGSKWIKDEAEAWLNIGAQQIIPGENYVVAYSCKKYEGQWRCGCAYQGGACNQWMLQTYLLRSVELPPEPVPPGSLTTTLVYASPNGELVRQGKSVNLNLGFQSTKDILEPVQNVQMGVAKPDSSVDNVPLEKFGGVNCQECGDNQCYRQFSCYVSFGGTYTPTLLGEYILNFGWGHGTGFTEGLRVETGKFKVVDPSFFSDNLIENDIAFITEIDVGNVVYYQNSYGWYDSEGYSLSANYQVENYPNGNSWITVNLNGDYNWIKSRERDFENSGEWSKRKINGNRVYVREEITPIYVKEGISPQGTSPPPDRKDYALTTIWTIWFSNGKMIEVNYYGPDATGYNKVVEAYLKKHPATDINSVERDFGDLKFKGKSEAKGCEILTKDEHICKTTVLKYSYPLKGLNGVTALIEEHEGKFSNQDAIDSLRDEYGRLGDTKSDEGGVLIFGNESAPRNRALDLALGWYSGNKVISIFIDDWIQDLANEDMLEELYELYRKAYPSDLALTPETNVRCEVYADWSNIKNQIECSVKYKDETSKCTIDPSLGYHTCDTEIKIPKPEPNEGFEPVPGLTGEFTNINCESVSTAYNGNYYFVNCNVPIIVLDQDFGPGDSGGD